MRKIERLLGVWSPLIYERVHARIVVHENRPRLILPGLRQEERLHPVQAGAGGAQLDPHGGRDADGQHSQQHDSKDGQDENDAVLASLASSSSILG